MRVISGKFRGRVLRCIEGASVRPTTDRIKETMFNMLSNFGVVGAEVLDLFCGSGALGIETLSRGAGRAVFVDSSKPALEIARHNLSNVDEIYELHNVDYHFALKKLSGVKFDIIFVDPPYNADYTEILNCIAASDCLNADGVIVAEHASGTKIQSSFSVSKVRECGQTTLTFLVK